MLILAAALLGLPGQAKACLYFVDAAHGNLYRSRFDGSSRELVLRLSAKNSTVSLVATNPSDVRRGALHLTSVPSHGYTVIDATPIAAKGLYQSGSFLDTGAPSDWRLKSNTARGVLQPGHYHDFVTSITASKGKTTRTYKGAAEIIGIASTGQAVVLEGIKLVLWDLPSDRRSVIASVSTAASWPRDLSSVNRFRPIARAVTKGAVYQWTITSPDDFRIKPAYLVRRR
jgi:hypothetical protein